MVVSCWIFVNFCLQYPKLTLEILTLEIINIRDIKVLSFTFDYHKLTINAGKNIIQCISILMFFVIRRQSLFFAYFLSSELGKVVWMMFDSLTAMKDAA